MRLENNTLVKICAETEWKSPGALPVALELISLQHTNSPRIYSHELVMSDILVYSSAARPETIPKPDNLVLYSRHLLGYHSPGSEILPLT